MAETTSRTFELIVWGATGFTGQLVAEYLQQRYGSEGDLRWAMAARNESKLRKVAEQIGAKVPLLIADSHDLAALKALCAQTRVICSVVGPYASYGSELVQACVEEETHYCDLTGEVPWMRKMIDQHHAIAQEKQLKIVHTCGFDSIPSDMGVYFMQKKAQAETGAYLQHIRFRLKAGKGGFSGGTIASLNQVLVDSQKDPSVLQVLANPYGLNPLGDQDGQDEPDLMEAKYDPIAKGWMAPFVMSAINTKVVRRSQALSGHPYGRDFRYEEATLMGDGWGSKIAARGMAWGMGLLQSATPGTPLGTILAWVMPKPGEGPSQSARENGFYVVDFFGTNETGQVYKCRVKGDRDPGYGSTCKMLAETAICLSRDEKPESYGVLTPSVAMGDALLKRLQENAGLSFSWEGLQSQ